VNPVIIKNTKIIQKNTNPNYKKNTTLSRAKLSTKGKYNIH
jgi:hypothetical protein